MVAEGAGGGRPRPAAGRVRPGGTRADAAPPVGWAALWFGFAAGPVMWSLQELVGYPITAMACFPATVPPAPAGPGPNVAMGLVSLVAFAVTLAALLVSIRSWRAAAALDPGDGPVASRVTFMAAGGVLTSVLFLFGIVLAAIPAFFMAACG